ncbi:MAG: HAD-IA family hydrolase [Pseudomonadota bacterium]
MTVEAVIFDIGNVLIEWNPERHYDKRIGRERRDALFDSMDLHAMNDAIDTGAPWKETVYATAEHSPEWGDEIRMWHDEWIFMASPAISHSVHLLRELRMKGVPVFALSNFGKETFAYAETQYDFLQEFDKRYISGHMGVIKPDQNIYRMVEEDCGLSGRSLLFTDDRAENIKSAKMRGWETHLFQNSQNWAATLIQHGLLTFQETIQ